MAGAGLVFEFDQLPPNANEYARMFWAKRGRVLEAWQWHVKAQLRQQLTYPPVWRRVRIHAVLRVGRRRDADNKYSMLKIPLDALRHESVILNDSQKVLADADLTVEQVLEPDPQQRGLTLTVWPLRSLKESKKK